MFEKSQLNCILHDGLGNRLFQIASLYAVAKDIPSCEMTIVDALPNAHSTKTYGHIYTNFAVLTTKDNASSTAPTLRVPEHLALTYSPDIVRKITTHLVESSDEHKRLNVVGFFQSEKYFKKYTSDVRHLFREPTFVTEHIEEHYSNLDKAYFIHVRLGDYLRSKLHFVDLTAYYETCLDLIGPDHIVLLFSNQVEKIDEVYPRLKTRPNVVVVDETDELVTMYLMARCEKGGICSNSSFSWWGSYLNKNVDKHVYMPRRWFHDRCTTVVDDVYYEGVRVIDV